MRYRKQKYIIEPTEVRHMAKEQRFERVYTQGAMSI